MSVARGLTEVRDGFATDRLSVALNAPPSEEDIAEGMGAMHQDIDEVVAVCRCIVVISWDEVRYEGLLDERRWARRPKSRD